MFVMATVNLRELFCSIYKTLFTWPYLMFSTQKHGLFEEIERFSAQYVTVAVTVVMAAVSVWKKKSNKLRCG